MQTNDPRTTRAALYSVISFVIVRIAAHFDIELPVDVQAGIVLLILCYGLHQAADSGGTPPNA